MDKKIGHEIKKLSYLIGQELRSNSLNLTGSQCFVISNLYMNGGSLNQNDINKILCSRRSTITSLINGLIKEGYIVKIKDKKDKRINVLKLTEKGNEYSIIINDNIEKNENKLQNSITEEEKENLFIILEKLCSSMKGDD